MPDADDKLRRSPLHAARWAAPIVMIGCAEVVWNVLHFQLDVLWLAIEKLVQEEIARAYRTDNLVLVEEAQDQRSLITVGGSPVHLELG